MLLMFSRLALIVGRQKGRSVRVQPNLKNTPPRVFLPAVLNKRRRHFAAAVAAPTSEESARGCLSLGVQSSVFRFPQASLSQFPQHPESAEAQNQARGCCLCSTLRSTLRSSLSLRTPQRLSYLQGSIRNSSAREAITQITGRLTGARLKETRL